MSDEAKNLYFMRGEDEINIIFIPKKLNFFFIIYNFEA